MAGIPKVKGAHSVAQPITLQVPPPEVEQTPVASPDTVLMPAGLPADLPAQALQLAMDALGITPEQLAAMTAPQPGILDAGITAAELATGELAEEPTPEPSPLPDVPGTATPEVRLQVAADMAADGDLTLAVQQLTAVMVQVVDAVRTIGAQQQWMTDRMVGMGEMFATAAPIIGGGGNPFTMFKKLASAMAAAGGRKEIEGG